MNDKNFNLIKKVFIVLLLLTFMYGFVSFDQIPLVQLCESVLNFSLENIIMGKALFFMQTLVLAIFLMEPFKVGLFILTSFLVNLLIFKLFGVNFDQPMLLNAVNFACFSGISAFFVEFKNNKNKRELYKYGLLMGLMPILFAFFIVTSLNFMVSVLPNTNDIQAIFIDNHFHIPRSINQYFYFFNDHIVENGLIYNIVFYGYNAITVGIVMLCILEFSEKNRRYYINTIVNALILLCLGLLLYMIFPIMGPKYLQMNLNSIITGSIKWSDYIGVVLTGTTFPRNGMPSMHFAITLFAFLNSKGLGFFKRSLFLVFFIVTAAATIILGEHYFIDWIGALPVIIISMILSDTYLSWKEKKYLLLGNLLNLGLFYMFLCYSIKYFSILFNCVDCENYSRLMTSVLYLITIGTVINFIYSYQKLYHLGQKKIEIQSQPNIDVFNLLKNDVRKSIQKIKHINNKTRLSALFILSGFAGLMYQVIFGKMLSTTFGSTSMAIYIILATYMIGLSIGSWLGGKQSGTASPILQYAFCEGLIALYCVLTPQIFGLLDSLYLYLLHYNIENVFYSNMIKILLGMIGLLIPTVLMGMTTPILLKEFNKDESSGLSITRLYTLNTLGASLGALLSGYILIPDLGVKSSIFMTVLLNLMICGYAINLFKKKIDDEGFKKEMKQAVLSFFDMFVIKSEKIIFIKTSNYYYGIIVLFLSGILTMVLETVFVHTLSIVVGNSTYVFSVMLFTFLLGLSIGGYIGKKMIEQLEININILASCELILGASILISFIMLDRIPNYFGSFAHSDTINNFVSQEFLKFIMCVAVMIVPTVLTGTIYTLAMKVLTLDNDEQVNQTIISHGLAINTIGNIIGIFVGGFLFVNIFQIQLSFKVLTLLFITISMLLSLKNKKYLVVNIMIFVTISFYSYNLNMKEITSGSNVYFNRSSRGDVLEFKESIGGGLTSVNIMQNKETNKTILTLLTNGKFQGNDSDESVAQGAFAITPMMHMSDIKNKNSLVIGYGTGMTTRAIYDAGFKTIDMVDLSSDILVLADKYFKNINKNIRSQKNVITHITDGRNYLKLTDKHYDLISMEITSIWFSGASYLYNQDFYKIAKQKMNPDAVLQQWVQMHHMNPNDFSTILNTIRSEFKYVSVYYIGGQGIIVATNSEKSRDVNENTLKELNGNQLLDGIKQYYQGDFKTIESKKVLDDLTTDKFLFKTYGKNMAYFISTDDNLNLEYSTPKGNSLKFDTEKSILEMIKKNIK